MSTAWLLVIVLKADAGSVVVPQLNCAVCIRNKNEEAGRIDVQSATCVKGDLPH